MFLADISVWAWVNIILILLVAYSDGMKVLRNNEQVEVNQIENCFITISLEEGENNIEIKYYIPGVKAGAIISFLGIIGLITCAIFEKNKKRKKEIKRWKKLVL